jgi:hypothetical protein
MAHCQMAIRLVFDVLSFAIGDIDRGAEPQVMAIKEFPATGTFILYCSIAVAVQMCTEFGGGIYMST